MHTMRATIPRFDRAPGLTHDEALLEDVRLAILSGTYIEDTPDDEDLPVVGRLQCFTHPEPETPQ